MMDINVTNEEYEFSGILDTYESLSWIDRFNVVGEFQIITPYSGTTIVLGSYLELTDSEKTMIVETIEHTNDVETGNKITYTGRSLESILDRRVYKTQNIFTGTVQDYLKSVLNDTFINPSDVVRKVNNFVFIDNNDSRLLEYTLTNADYYGYLVSDIVSEICQYYHIGYSITMNENVFEFRLFLGKDLTYSQIDNPPVVFSEEMDNLTNSNSYSSQIIMKNSAFVLGEKDYNTGKQLVSNVGVDDTVSGLKLREVVINASDISQTSTEITLTDEEYVEKLTERGLEQLETFNEIEMFNGEVDFNLSFKYGTDYVIGDIVEVSNVFSDSNSSRIIEIIISDSLENGYRINPTFQNI